MISFPVYWWGTVNQSHTASIISWEYVVELHYLGSALVGQRWTIDMAWWIWKHGVEQTFESPQILHGTTGMDIISVLCWST